VYEGVINHFVSASNFSFPGHGGTYSILCLWEGWETISPYLFLFSSVPSYLSWVTPQLLFSFILYLILC
jgi:hypothetical protein